MGASAVDAEAVEGRDPDSRRVVAVGTAANPRHVLKIEADLSSELAGVVEQAGGALRALIGRAIHSPGDGDAHVRIVRREIAERGRIRLPIRSRRYAEVDAQATMLGRDIDGRAAGDEPDGRRHATGVVGHALDVKDLTGRLPDRAAPVLVA